MMYLLSISIPHSIVQPGLEINRSVIPIVGEYILRCMIYPVRRIYSHYLSFVINSLNIRRAYTIDAPDSKGNISVHYHGYQ